MKPSCHLVSVIATVFSCGIPCRSNNTLSIFNAVGPAGHRDGPLYFNYVIHVVSNIFNPVIGNQTNITCPTLPNAEYTTHPSHCA